MFNSILIYLMTTVISMATFANNFDLKLSTLATSKKSFDLENARPRRKGIVLFKLKKNILLEDLSLSQLNFTEPGTESAPSADFSKSRLIHSSKIYEIQFDDQKNQNPFISSFLNEGEKTNNSEEHLAAQLMNSGMVEYAEPDYASLPDIKPNDSEISSQWYLDKLGLPTAWEVSTGSNQVQVLVCDTGVLSNHPDLKGNVVAGVNFIDGTTRTEPTGNAHGTLVSGLIGAKGNNGTGIAGVNWNIQIIPGKISNEVNGLSHTSTMIKCIQWAMDHKIRLVNLSYNGAGSEALADASKALFETNGLLMFTIGNTSEEVTFPKNPYAIRVGASDSFDFKSYFSNTGISLDIVAPGASIYSTDDKGGIKRVQGTSFSAPLVTGAAALLLSIDSTLTAAELRKILLESAKDLGYVGFDKAFGNGRLDIANAITKYRELKGQK